MARLAGDKSWRLKSQLFLRRPLAEHRSSSLTGSRSTSASLSINSAEGLRDLQASRRRSTSQYVGAVSTAGLMGTRNLSFKYWVTAAIAIFCRGGSHAAGPGNKDYGDVDYDDCRACPKGCFARSPACRKNKMQRRLPRHRTR